MKVDANDTVQVACDLSGDFSGDPAPQPSAVGTHDAAPSMPELEPAAVEQPVALQSLPLLNA